ncbi:MAG: VPLPA-CTERM sorting domain-containing protein [Desulfuromonadales bacterium]|nr:VPLPA-CTERM sorting domain-containing protein [Desulfuromonadales bacterium]
MKGRKDMRKLVFLVLTLVCMSWSQAYADYAFNFNSGDGTLILSGILNTNNQNVITGGSLLSSGSEYNGTTFIVGSLTSVLGPLHQGASYPATATSTGGISTFMGYGGAYATYDNQLTSNPNKPFNVTDYTVNQNIILAASTNTSTSGYYVTLAYDGGNVYDSYNMTPPGSAVDTVFNNAVATATPTTTPIPAAAWLLGSGLMGLAGLRRRKTING